MNRVTPTLRHILLVSACSSVLGAAPAGPDVVEEARGYLTRLAQVDSPPGGEVLLLEEANRYARSQGLYATVHPSAPGRANLVVRLPSNPVGSRQGPLVLAAHVDVPPGAPLLERDGVWTGGGVTAGKAFAAAALAVMLQLHRANTPRAREVDLVLASDGTGNAQQGIAHLLNVLPTLGAGGVMVFSGGATLENTVLVHAGAKQPQPVRLVAQVQSAGLGQPGTTGAMRVLAPALEKVETHAFPLPWSGATVEWGGALGLTAQSVSQRARTEPALAALLATTCQVGGVAVDRAVQGVPEKVAADVMCFLSPGEAVQHFGWRVVDAVKDTRVTVDRTIVHPVPPPHALTAEVDQWFGAAFPSQRLLPVALPATPEHQAMFAHGPAFGIPLGQGTGGALRQDQFAGDVHAMAALVQRAVTP